jgi:triosephosphate isomerase
MSVRRPLVGGNWKMHKTQEEARACCLDLIAGLGAAAADVVVFPSPTLLPVVGEVLQGGPIAWGGQDIHPEDEGAHTGDVSGRQLVDVGCSWTLCGHSERRRDHCETDEVVARKALAACRHNLSPLVCVGESAEARSEGKTFDVLQRQIDALRVDPPDQFELAYEPIWAIGSGNTATPEQAQEAHAFIRQRLAATFGSDIARTTRILYGGSVKPGNAADLIDQPDLDGFLVGGASLDTAQFLAIIGACGR